MCLDGHMGDWARLGRNLAVDDIVVGDQVQVIEVVYYQCSLPRQWVAGRVEEEEELVPCSRRRLDWGHKRCCSCSSSFDRGGRIRELR